MQDINSPEIYKSFSSIGFASDAYINPQSIVDSISQRFDSVLRKIKNIDGFIRLQLWMETVLSDSIELSINDFLKRTNNSTS